jgi:hypothetical protein
MAQHLRASVKKHCKNKGWRNDSSAKICFPPIGVTTSDYTFFNGLGKNVFKLKTPKKTPPPKKKSRATSPARKGGAGEGRAIWDAQTQEGEPNKNKYLHHTGHPTIIIALLAVLYILDLRRYDGRFLLALLWGGGLLFVLFYATFTIIQKIGGTYRLMRL